MARIYKKNNSYYFSFEAGRDERTGKRQRIVRGGFRTKKEAQQASVELEVKFNIGNVIAKPSDITLHDFMWKHWLPYHSQFVKPSTIRSNIQVSLKRIDKFFGNTVKIKDISPYQCTLFVNALLNRFNLKRCVAAATFIWLKIMFNYAVQIEKTISQNPCDNITIPRYTLKEKEYLQQHQKEKTLYLEKDMLKKFLSAAQQDERAFPYYTVVLLLSHTGMRIGELLGLQWEDIDMQNKLIHVTHTIYYPDRTYTLQSAKTASSVRDIVLSDSLVEHLKQYRKQYLAFKLYNRDKWADDNYDFVITSRAYPGKPLSVSTLRHWMNRLAAKIGLPDLHPHVFRHTHVSLLAEAGVPLAAICERLGHAHDKVTENIYLHITKKTKADAAEKFEKLISNL